MKFIKMHGLGNDFIVVNNLKGKLSSPFLAQVAPKLCHRHFGVGADGLVLLNPSSRAPFQMQIFNPDGSEAEMCGNAIRCLAKYVFERGLIREKSFAFETKAGNKEVVIKEVKGQVKAVRVNMGKPLLHSEEIPIGGLPRDRVVNEALEVEGEKLFFTAVSMGNPHCVIFLDSLDSIPWKRWGSLLECHPLFPRRTNVEFVKKGSPREIEVKVWERGAGPTLACGTGACASVVAGVLTGRLREGEEITVYLPGGSLLVKWEQGGSVFMEGPAEEVFTGEISAGSNIMYGGGWTAP